jgi:hypothetical protein
MLVSVRANEYCLGRKRAGWCDASSRYSLFFSLHSLRLAEIITTTKGVLEQVLYDSIMNMDRSTIFLHHRSILFRSGLLNV